MDARTSWNDEEISETAAPSSIRKDGQLHPIPGPQSSKNYPCIFGGERCRTVAYNIQQLIRTEQVWREPSAQPMHPNESGECYACRWLCSAWVQSRSHSRCFHVEFENDRRCVSDRRRMRTHYADWTRSHVLGSWYLVFAKINLDAVRDSETTILLLLSYHGSSWAALSSILSPFSNSPRTGKQGGAPLSMWIQNIFLNTLSSISSKPILGRCWRPENEKAK